MTTTQLLLGDGRYRLERVLGHGGMASVHLAHDSALDRTVAIKLVSEAFAADEDARRRLVREARLAARLSHPNVVRIYDVSDAGERPYLVLEHVDGPTLAEELSRRGRYPPEEVVRIGKQVCAGLAHAHTAGLVHRDVKPRNLLRAPDGTVKIADFGIARADDSTQITLAGTVLGTAAYLAPEQARGERVTPAADVYALGVVLYELLTGKPPHEAHSLPELVSRQARGKVTPPSRAVLGVTGSFDSIVLACLSLDPRARPSCDEIAAALSSGSDADVPTAPLPAAPTPGPGASPALNGGRRRHLLRLGRPDLPAARASGRWYPLHLSLPRLPHWLASGRWRPAHLGRRSALVAVAITCVGVAVGFGLTAGGVGTERAGQTPRVVAPVPKTDDPAELARALARWLRDHGR